MSMKSKIRDTLAKIADDLKQGVYDKSKEDEVKQGIVMCLLGVLGWDIHNTKEVIPEFTVNNKKNRIDIALFRNRLHVFIEVKKIGKITPDNEEQAFFYAYHKGTPLLILTTGERWHFYDARAHDGDPTQKLFHELNISEMSAEECADIFFDFLSREEVISGRAARQAEEAIRHKKHNAIMGSMRQAWDSLLDESPKLRSLIRDKTEQICGHSPDNKMIDEFLSKQKSESTSTPQVSPKEIDNSNPRSEKFRTRSLSQIKLVGFVYDGQRYECKHAKDVLFGVLDAFSRKKDSFIEDYATKSKYVKRNQTDLFNKKPSPKQLKWQTRKIIVNDEIWWVNVNHSIDGIEKIVKHACEVMGVTYGKELKILTENKDE